MRWTAALAPGIGVLMFATTVVAEPQKIAYPGGYQDEFIEYLRVDRPDRKIVRFMYVNPAAHEAAQPGEPLPDGTVLVMEDHKARLGAGEEAETDAEGRLVPTDEVTNVFVMEKRERFGEEYPPEKRNGEWEYAWFLPDGSRKADAEFDGCFSCHLSRAERDFTFTFYKYVRDEKGSPAPR
jgi:hypothetical protein